MFSHQIPNYIKAIFIILLIFLSDRLQAQSSINELTELSTSLKKDENWVDRMILKIDDIIRTNPQSAYKFSMETLDVASKINYSSGIRNAKIQNAHLLVYLEKYSEAENILKNVLKSSIIQDDSSQIKAMTILSMVNFYQGDFNQADSVLKDAEQLLGNDTSSLLYANIINNKANLFSLQGNNKLAFENYLVALDIYKLNNKKPLIAVVYGNIGAECSNMGMFKKALVYYDLAIEINELAGNYQDLTRNLVNKGISFKELNLLDSAIIYYNKAIKIAEKNNYVSRLAQAYTNIGSIFLEKMQFDDALQYFNKSLDICRKNNLPYGSVINFTNAGNTYQQMGDYSNAIANLDSAMIYSSKLKVPKELCEIYKQLATVYETKGDFKNAYKFQILHSQISDSLVTAEKYQKVLELEKKYENSEKQKEIADLKIKGVRHKLAIGYLALAALLLTVITTWFYFKRKATYHDHILAEVNAEKLRLEIKVKNNEITQKALNISHLQENNKYFTSTVETFLKDANISKTDTERFIKKIKMTTDNANIWDEFDIRFKELHTEFYLKIVANYPDLSPVELRIVSLLRLNLTTKEIAEILQRSIKTVENNRVLIRKKMNLDREVNLTSFILAYK